MKQLKTEQISISDIENTNFDLSIYSCGFEKRSIFLSQKNIIKSRNQVVFKFLTEERLNMKTNYEYYISNKFNIVNSQHNVDLEITNYLNEFIKNNLEQNVLNIIIDYSSMNRIWFSSILKYFYNLSLFKGELNLFFSYSHAKFSIPKKINIHNVSVGPLNGFCKISIPNLPSALVIGLGYEKIKAIGLAHYFDAKSYIFLSDNSYSPEYNDLVKLENENLLKGIEPDNIFEYPILDLTNTSKILNTLLIDLSNSNRIILAPCGPKIFSLLCLIESLKFENVDVWRISSVSQLSNEKEEDTINDKEPDGNISIFKVTITS